MNGSQEFMKQLKQLYIFQTLTNEELQYILPLIQKQKIQKGAHLFFQNDAVTAFYFIEFGKIKVYKLDENGNEKIVQFFDEGDMFPHVGFFQQATYPANASAVVDSSLFVLPTRKIEKLLYEYPSITLKIFSLLEEKIIDLQSRLSEQLFLSTSEKLYHLLLRLGKKEGLSVGNDWVQLRYFYTNVELANMIGTTRETANRIINKLKQQNLLTITDDGYYQIHIQGLQDMVQSM